MDPGSWIRIIGLCGYVVMWLCGYWVIGLGDERIVFNFLMWTGHKVGLRDCILRRVF
jgi:hypothetical protein